LAPLLGFLLLLVELRVDGCKIYHLLRRPHPHAAEDIGSWYIVLEAVSWMGLVTNSMLNVFTMGSFDSPPGYFGTFPQGVYFAFNAGGLALAKVALSLLLPEMPSSVEVATSHQDWLRIQLDHSGDARKAARSKVDLRALDLTVDDAAQGLMRDPREFGTTAHQVCARYTRATKHRHSHTSLSRSDSMVNAGGHLKRNTTADL